MKRKNFFVAMLLLTGFILSFNSCKKGENDPSISLKSRDARITAKWKLTKIEATGVHTWGTTTSTTTTAYDGTIYTQTNTGSPSTSATGSYEMTIDKQGQVSWSENYTESGGDADIKSGEGQWGWMNSDKNKEFIWIDGGYNLFEGGMFYVDRLASKELILHYTYKYVNNGNTNSYDKKYTFTKQ